jgi:hypothetical protein
MKHLLSVLFDYHNKYEPKIKDLPLPRSVAI